MKKLLLFALCLAPIALFAQSPVIGGNGVLYVSAAPSGTCNAWSLAEFVVPAGSLYTCQSGTWAQVSGSGGGVSTASLPLAITGANIAISQANSTTNGYLGSTDWSTFNGKQVALTNPVTAPSTLAPTTKPLIYGATATTVAPDSNITTDGSGNLTVVSIIGGSAVLGTPSTAANAALPTGAHGAAMDESSTAGVPAASVDYIRADATSHRLKQSLNNGAEVNIPIPSEIPAAQVAANLASSGTTGVTGVLPSTQVSPVPVPTPGSSITLAGPSGFAICTTTCTVAVPVPVAGYQFCILNDDNVSTAITLSALGSSARYENSARTAYGTAGTGTLVVSAAVGDMVCIVGRDSTHYLTTTYSGTVTVN